MSEILELCFKVYLAMAIIKFILCAPHMPAVMMVLSRLSGARKGQLYVRYIFFVPPLVVCVSFFGWVYSLYQERGRFFLLYTRRSVIRDCVSAYVTR